MRCNTKRYRTDEKEGGKAKEKMACANRGGYILAARRDICNMTYRSVKPAGEKFQRERDGITRNLYLASSNACKCTSESSIREAERRSESESRERVNSAAAGGEGVKRKEQAIRRAAGDRTRGEEGVAIFH